MPRPANFQTRRIQIAFRLPPEIFAMLPPVDHSGTRGEYVIAAIREKHEADSRKAKKEAKDRYKDLMADREMEEDLATEIAAARAPKKPKPAGTMNTKKPVKRRAAK